MSALRDRAGGRAGAGGREARGARPVRGGGGMEGMGGGGRGVRRHVNAALMCAPADSASSI